MSLLAADGRPPANAQPEPTSSPAAAQSAPGRDDDSEALWLDVFAHLATTPDGSRRDRRSAHRAEPRHLRSQRKLRLSGDGSDDDIIIYEDDAIANTQPDIPSDIED